MIQYKKITIAENYYSFELFECPLAIILFAAGLASEHVTVENFKNYRNVDICSVRIKTDAADIQPNLLRYTMDFTMRKKQFIALADIWDSQGCFAVFHEKDTLSLKATDLKGAARYKALDNFGWTLEIAVPDSASSGWGSITSPRRVMMDLIEDKIKSFGS